MPYGVYHESFDLISEKGQHIPQDYKHASRWYRLEAEQGDPFAQYNLGYLYANGEGVLPDCVQAHMWLNLVGASGDADAVKYREIVASRMTAEQIAEAQNLAREWKPRPEAVSSSSYALFLGRIPV